MFFILTGVGILVASVLAIVAKRLLISAIWLAVTSALVAVMIYLLGAPHIAVIELSVGAGLVTVLFVFAINIAGEESTRLHPQIPRQVAIPAVVLGFGLALVVVLRSVGVISLPEALENISEILWDQRYLDLLLQIVLIFAGVLGVLGLLSSDKPAKELEEEE
jgi:uncharacterized MnhB-related membrane protein